MSLNKFIIQTNAKRSHIESTETHYKLKSIPITVNGATMNGILYPKSENEKGIPTIVGKPFTIDHPVDKSGNFISATEGEGLTEFFSGGVVTNAYEVDDVWYVDAEIKKSLLMAQNNGKELADKLEGKEDLGVSTGLYFNDNKESGHNEKGEAYNKIAKGQKFNHLAAVDNPAGGSATTAVFNSESTFICNFEDIAINKEPSRKSEDKRGPLARAWNAVKSVFGVNTLSHSEIHEALHRAIRSEIVGDDKYSLWILSVYNDYFIYADEKQGKYYQRSYSVGADNNIIVESDAVEVKQQFVKVNKKQYNKPDLNTNGDREMRNLIEAELKAKGIEVNGLDESQLLAAYNEQLTESAEVPQVNTQEMPEWAKQLQANVQSLQSSITANAEQELNGLAEQVAALNMGLDAEAAKKLGVEGCKSFLTANSATSVAGYPLAGGRQTVSTNSAESFADVDLNAGLED